MSLNWVPTIAQESKNITGSVTVTRSYSAYKLTVTYTVDIITQTGYVFICCRSYECEVAFLISETLMIHDTNIGRDSLISFSVTHYSRGATKPWDYLLG